MKESATYQSIVEEGEAKGRAEEARKILLRQGGRRFGAPDARTQGAIEAITSVEQLEALLDRVLEVENWTDLLATARGA